MSHQQTEPTLTRGQSLLLRFFDIRNIIGALLGIYGVLLLIAGLIPAIGTAGASARNESDNLVNLAAGTDANIWVGLILIAAAAVFAAWAIWKPSEN